MTALNASRLPNAYELIRQGLNILTCDCTLGDWAKNLKTTNMDFASYPRADVYEFYFCKAFLMICRNGLQSNYVALDHIEQFLSKYPDDSIGWYIKARALTNLEKFAQAYDAYTTSIDLEYSIRTLYRRGRLTAIHLQGEKLDDLFYAFIGNQSSKCCCRVLQSAAFTRGMKISFNESNYAENLLISSFNETADPWQFQKVFEDIVALRPSGTLFQSFATDLLLDDFVRQLTAAKQVFVSTEVNEDMQEGENSENDYNYDYEDHGFEPDYDEMYFDAMTDGQLGTYDEFLDHGGNLDYLDDWAGR